MSVKFQDYYETLGVAKGASQDEIQKAFRKLARKFHPDVSKEKGAEDKFKRINEAYEVLKDPEKRSRYDAIGSGFHGGQDFEPPPGFDFSNVHFQSSGAQGFDLGGFSDFFEMLFGGGAGMSEQFGESLHRGSQSGKGRTARQAAPTTLQTDITLSIDEIIRGGTKRITLQEVHQNGNHARRTKERTIDLKIPGTVREGTVIRLAGQGGSSQSSAPAGDLLIKVHVAPSVRYRIEGDDIISRLPIAPWEAALGKSVQVKLIDGDVRVTVPSGSQNGQRLRLRGRGLNKKGGERGDLYLELAVVVPQTLSKEERDLMERLASVSSFDPRANV